jgi:hypothetical protein
MEDPAIQADRDRREAKSSKEFTSSFESGPNQRQRCVFA